MVSEIDINKIIGERIILFRKENNISRKKFADILEITQQQLSKYESGENRISAAKLAIISYKFKIDISYFFQDLFDKNLNQEKNKNIFFLKHYFLNVKKEEIKDCLLSIMKELSKK